MTATTLRPIIVTVASRKSHFRTDESGVYWAVGEEFKSHQTVNHSAEEYVRGDAHTNTAEGFFSVFKRGVTGTYHCSCPRIILNALRQFTPNSGGTE